MDKHGKSGTIYIELHIKLVSRDRIEARQSEGPGKSEHGKSGFHVSGSTYLYIRIVRGVTNYREQIIGSVLSVIVFRLVATRIVNSLDLQIILVTLFCFA